MKVSMRRWALLLAGVVFLFACAFTGCESGRDDNYVPPNGEEEDPGVNDDPYKETRTYIKVAINSSVASEKNLALQLRKGFLSHQNTVGINFTYFSNYTDYMYKCISNNDFPDVIWSAGDMHSVYSEAGHFVNLRPYIEAEEDMDVSDYYEKVLQSAAYGPEDDGIWIAPRDYNRPVTILNREMFEAAGVPIPTAEEWNADKFMEVCAALRVAMDKNTDRNLGVYHTSTPCDANIGWSPMIQTLIRSFGGNLYNTAEKTVTVNSDESVTAYKRIGELIQKGYVINPNSATGVFPSRRAAMAFIVRSQLPSTIGKYTQSYCFLPFPFESVGVGFTGYGMTAASEHKEEAWAFLKFVMTEPGQKIMGKMGNGVPVLKSLQDDSSWTDYCPGVDQSAFVAHPERDFTLNDVNVFPFSKRNDIKTEAEDIMSALGNDATWKYTPLDVPKNAKWTTGSWSDEGNWTALISAADKCQADTIAKI